MKNMTKKNELILASSSSTRIEILKKLGLQFKSVSPDIDETRLVKEPAKNLALRLAKEKNLVVAENYPNALVIGSDQVAVCCGTILSKPLTIEKAVEQLLWQRGKKTEFFTALALSRKSGKMLKISYVKSTVEFLNEQNLISFKSSIEKNKIPTESYKRFAKILLSDGSNDFFIQEPNLDFEFIALNSPYDQNNFYFEFQLYKKTKPFGNWDVNVFSKNDENVFKEIVKTNPNGIGKLRLFDNRIYLLSAVDLRKADYMDKIKHKSDWLSFWASLVFRR